MSNSLDFEQPIVDLEAKIDELRRVDVDGALDLHREIERLETKSRKLTREIFSSLDAWQITQLARHPQRPHTLDYISRIFSNFQELSGDRMYRDDPAVVGGLARIGGKGVMIIGHQKGQDTKEKCEETSDAQSRRLSQGSTTDAYGRKVRTAGRYLD